MWILANLCIPPLNYWPWKYVNSSKSLCSNQYVNTSKNHSIILNWLSYWLTASPADTLPVPYPTTTLGVSRLYSVEKIPKPTRVVIVWISRSLADSKTNRRDFASAKNASTYQMHRTGCSLVPTCVRWRTGVFSWRPILPPHATRGDTACPASFSCAKQRASGCAHENAPLHTTPGCPVVTQYSDAETLDMQLLPPARVRDHIAAAHTPHPWRARHAPTTSTSQH